MDTSIRECAEFIQSGSPQDTEKGLRKLLQYEEVDIVIGVVSSKVALSVIPLLEKKQTPMILLNLGADIPVPGLSSEFLFYNSLHLWKSEWAIGRWAQLRFGGEASLNMALYEGGYGLSEAYKTGAASAGAETMKLNIVKNHSPSPDTSPLIQYLDQQRPSHTHALLSGKEGQQFLELFHRQGLGERITLSVNPFMAEDGILQSIPGELFLHNALTWAYSLDTACNRRFIGEYEGRFQEQPNVFSLLAYEAGLALAAAVAEQEGKMTGKTLSAALAQAQPRGPRGLIHLSTRPLQTEMPVYIRRPVLSPVTELPQNVIEETLNAIEWNDPSLGANDNYFSGWQNPYLCV